MSGAGAEPVERERGEKPWARVCVCARARPRARPAADRSLRRAGGRAGGGAGECVRPARARPPARGAWLDPTRLPTTRGLPLGRPVLPALPPSSSVLFPRPPPRRATPGEGGLFPGQGDLWGEPGVARNRLSPCALAMPRAPPGTPACALPTRKSPVLSLPQGQCASFLSSLSGPRTSEARCPQPPNPSPPGWLPPPAA